jgi:predicted RNase H-like HicB family nuclease
MVEGMRRFTVRYERDEGGWWVATVPRLRGCHTQGRTLDEARRRVREAMALFIEDAESVEIRDQIRLPKDVQRTIRRVAEVRRTAAKLRKQSAGALEKAVDQLSRRLNLSTRDQADLLGLSHQRIQQIKRRAS